MSTTVKISEKTHGRLEKDGLKGETFDDIINRALDVLERAESENNPILGRV